MAVYRAGKRWRCVVRVRRNGRQVSIHSEYFDLKDDALACEAEVKARLARTGSWSDPRAAGKRWFQDVLERYRDEVTAYRPEASRVSETARINALLRSPLADAPLSQLAGEINLYLRRRQAKVSPSTIHREWNLLSAILNEARDVWHEPIPEMKRPQLEHDNPPRRRVLTQSELGALFEALGQARNKQLLPVGKLAYFTAQRRANVVGLTWEQVDFSLRELRFHERAQRAKGRVVEVLLTDNAVDLLRSLGSSGQGPVFPGLTDNAVKLGFQRAVKRAGLIDVQFRDLRRTRATELIGAGMSYDAVCAVTGHVDTRILSKHYVAPDRRNTLARINTIDRTTQVARSKTSPQDKEPEDGEGSHIG